MPPPPPSGTLYVASTTTTVYAYPLGSNGTTSASRTILPHPGHARITTALATNADGTLDVLQNYFDTNGVEHCAVTVEPADANGSPTTAPNTLCEATPTPIPTAAPANMKIPLFTTSATPSPSASPTASPTASPSPGPTPASQGNGVARNAIGGFDIAYNTTTAFNVKRFSSDGAALDSTLPLALGFAGIWLSTDKGGHDYLANNGGEVRKYAIGATDVSNTVADCTVSAANGDGPLVVAPDKTIYLVVKTEGDLANETIEAITGCGTSGPATVSRTIGPFPDKYISALAVDQQNELYVALNNLTNEPSSVIRVYGPTATGKAMPVRVITPSPATNFIRGLAVFEPAS